MTQKTALNPGQTTQQARKDLLKILEAVRGKKTLVIEKSLLGPIGLFIKFSTLQEYGVDKLFVLENKNVQPTQKNIVFLARGEKPKQVQLVADQIKSIRSSRQIDHDFSIVWLPRRTLVSDDILQDTGVLGDASIQQCPLYFISLEPDLLSLELEDAFGDIYLRKDPTYLFLAANALMLLQRSLGLFPHIQAKGDNATRLARMLLNMRAEDDVNASSDPSNAYLSSFGMTPSSIVDTLVIIDRAVDFPTTLMTQLTYEGLLDESFCIRYNQIEVGSSIVGVPPQHQTTSTPSASDTKGVSKRKVQLDSTDKLYPDLRDANFAVVGSRLSKTARRLQADYESRHKADQSISDLKTFVARLPSYQAEQASLKTHTALAEEITKLTRSSLFGHTLEMQQNLAAGADTSSMHDEISELMARDTPLITILRLLCLESSLTNGIRQRDLDALKHSIIHAYGPQHLLTFANLEKMGLLVPRSPNTGYLNPLATSASSSGGATDYNSTRKSLKLFVDDVDESDPTDISFTFSGYAPLSVRLVQCALQKGFMADLNPPGSRTGIKSPAGIPAKSRIQSSQPGWKPFEDILARVKGATFSHVQKPNDPEASKARTVLRGGNGTQSKSGLTSIVFFLGGITYAEIAALRLVARQLEAQQKTKLIIATTAIISGDRVIEAAVETRTFKPASDEA